eukprot:TRINITY_DN13593_c0_g1_i1.p1 TRINITY_DN13593_c0_g1~~TRINITY_DN13593_c0_g1_i1.p1  ORF type:complete len:635 (+),score=94.25 TRINITY_DN13593_c0_g1_i1:257-2161(+)
MEKGCSIVGMDTACPVTMISEKTMPVYHNVKAQRPTEEIVLSVWDQLGLLVEKDNPLRDQIRDTVTGICNGEASLELIKFDSQLQMLLNTLFAQIADFVDLNTKGTNIQVDNVDCDVLGGLISPSTISDVVAAARESLLLYHKQSTVLREANSKMLSPWHTPTEGRSPASSQGDKPKFKRRLSSVHPDIYLDPALGTESCDGSETKTVADTFVMAFQSGEHDTSTGKTAPKRRPSTRVERSDNSRSPSPSPRNDDSLSVTDIDFIVSPPEQEGREPSRRSRRSSTVCPVPLDLEKRLYSLTTLQYFDIIAQTLSLSMCVVYEEQLLSLTTEGSTAGISRLAEWVTARIIDELSQEGIDSTLPLDTQLLHCVEGIAYEDDTYHWRRLSKLGDVVIETVWGESPPDDIVTGKINCKDETLNWFEWGVLQKPGFKTSNGRSFTGPRLNPLQYNYRLSTLSVVRLLGLNEVSVSSPIRAPSFLGKRPGESLLQDTEAITCPGLTLSAPPEGSSHRGNHKQKPHIRPKSPIEYRELERKYKRKHRRSRQKQKLENIISNNSESGSSWSASDAEVESCEGKDVVEQQTEEKVEKPQQTQIVKTAVAKDAAKPPPEIDLSSDVVEGPSPKKNTSERCCSVS